MSTRGKEESEALPDTVEEDLELVRRALAGDVHANEVIYDRVESLIKYKNREFCTEHCRWNYSSAVRCVVSEKLAQWARPDAPDCEEGDASFYWMYEQLIGPSRLAKYEGRNGARLSTYLHSIALDWRFKSQWMDHRRGRRIVVPDYIKALHVHAERVYWWLCDKHPIERMAVRLGMSDEDVLELRRRIERELERRGKLRMLYPGDTVSLGELKSFDGGHDNGAGGEWDVPCDDPDPEINELLERAAEVVESMEARGEVEWVHARIYRYRIIEGWSADEVLQWLREHNLSIRADLASADVTDKHIYAAAAQVAKEVARRIDFD